MILQRALMGATNSGGLVTSGLVFHLDAGNPASYPGSGSTWTDLIHGAQGTLQGTYSYSANDGGYLQSGVQPFGAVFSTFPANLPTGTAARTICVMCYVTATDSSLFAFGDNAFDGSRLQTIIRTDFFNNYAEVRNGIIRTTESATLNTWMMITTTMPQSSTLSQLQIYRNDVSLTMSVFGGGTIQMNTASFWKVGKYWDNTNTMRGRLATMHIYNRVLTNAEIAQNFQAQRGRFGI